MQRKNKFLLFICIFLFLFFVNGVLSVDWNDSTQDFYGLEDNFYSYNVSKNVTDVTGNLKLNIDTESNVSWDNGSINFFNGINSLYWINYNQSNFILNMNSAHDNQTGKFKIPFQAGDDDPQEVVNPLYFLINATNDFPYFLNINSTYDFNESNQRIYSLTAFDEEEHYPLDFNISWENNCTHASWSGRNSNENCSLFDFNFTLSSLSDSSAIMNFTPGHNEVGTYWANISVMDFGENYPCPHQYCDNSTYMQNKTTIYPVRFNIFSSLFVNVSNCDNTNWTEGENLVCNISIRTRGEEDVLDISSIASLPNSDDSNIQNISWFYGNNQTNSSSFTKEISINISSLEDSQVGNWSINFSISDLTSGESRSEIINLFINNTEDNVLISSISDLRNVYENHTFYINASDNDLLVPDKSVKNESLSFSSNDTGWIDVSKESVHGNFSIASIFINHNEAVNQNLNETNQSVKINVSDRNGLSSDEDVFYVEILTDHAPVWNLSNTDFLINEDENFYLNLSKNVSDEDSIDTISFYYSNESYFPSFSLDSNSGEVNFTPEDEDVGFQNITFIASDGKINSSVVFNFTINNTPDAPLIDSFQGDNASIDNISNPSQVNVTEDNFTTLYLNLEDDDYLIRQKDFYDEDLNVVSQIIGPNSSLFDFSLASSPGVGQNLVVYSDSFTPSKSDVGNYTISINITDNFDLMKNLSFNLTVIGVEHGPVLEDLDDQYSAINRSFYYDIDATDLEEINDSVGNLSFSYEMLSGSDIFNNSFNQSTGEFNITFNSSNGGKYHLNISVQDPSNNINSSDFWIYVYDVPQINFPELYYNFTGQENLSQLIIFNANHSVGDTLIYEVRMDSIKVVSYVVGNSTNYNFSYGNFVLRNSSESFGDGTNFTWNFTPNFTDETYGLYKNISLTVYPSTSYLSSANSLNSTMTWKINITHKNHPLSFHNNIPNQSESYRNDISIDLKNHFLDYDFDDDYYNQSFDFDVNHPSPTTITSNVSSDWILTLSSPVTTTEILNVTVFENSISNPNNTLRNVTSNSFEVRFTEPPTKKTPTSTRTKTKEVPVYFKLVVPDPVSAYQNEIIRVPISLINSGDDDLEEINLESYFSKNSSLFEGDIYFEKSFFDSINSGDTKNTSLIIHTNTNETGLYEITINATVEDPEYYDFGKLFLTIKETNKTEIRERLLFTEEFLIGNPVCAEYVDLLEEAKIAYDNGDIPLAKSKISNALSSCNQALTKKRAPLKESFSLDSKLFTFVLVFTSMIFVFTLGYYFYKKKKFRYK